MTDSTIAITDDHGYVFDSGAIVTLHLPLDTCLTMIAAARGIRVPIWKVALSRSHRAAHKEYQRQLKVFFEVAQHVVSEEMTRQLRESLEKRGVI